MTVFRPAGEFVHHLPFERAKGRLAVGLENLRDAPARARLDEFVGVQVIEMQLLGDEPAHGSLARAHEADEREIDDAAVALHGNELTQFFPRRTPQIISGHSGSAGVPPAMRGNRTIGRQDASAPGQAEA